MDHYAGENNTKGHKILGALQAITQNIELTNENNVTDVRKIVKNVGFQGSFSEGIDALGNALGSDVFRVVQNNTQKGE